MNIYKRINYYKYTLTYCIRVRTLYRMRLLFRLVINVDDDRTNDENDSSYSSSQMYIIYKWRGIPVMNYT